MTENVPEPILEQGDFVRLKEPYRVRPESMADGLKETIKALAVRRATKQQMSDLLSRWEQGGRIVLDTLKRRDEFVDLFEFTHGTVAEVVSRYPARREQIPGGQVVQFPGSEAMGPPRNVSLHLFNENGNLYAGGHPTEPVKPEFVDHHVADLVLIHKHDEAWPGNTRELDLASAYEEWGFEEPAGFDPWRDDDGE